MAASTPLVRFAAQMPVPLVGFVEKGLVTLRYIRKGLALILPERGEYLVPPVKCIFLLMCKAEDILTSNLLSVISFMQGATMDFL